MAAAGRGGCQRQCLLLLLVAVGMAQAAQMLSAGDAHWLKVLAPHARSGIPGWAERHEELAAEVAAAAADDGGLDILVYGDSIMEAWRGQSVGYDDLPRYSANKAAWELNVTSKHKAAVIAIAGDQTVHLLWRLRNGEGPRGLRPRVITLMIGTNDVGHLGSTPVLKANSTLVGHLISLGAQECVWELQRQAPQATIVVFGLLPFQPLGAPPLMFERFVAATNADLAAAVRGQDSPQLHFKDCGGRFLSPNDGSTSNSVDYRLMPDGIHPSEGGARVLLQCMLEAIIDAALPEGAEGRRRTRRR